MSRKRKRLKKLIMALRIPRDDTDFYINWGQVWNLSYAEMILDTKKVIIERQGG